MNSAEKLPPQRSPRSFIRICLYGALVFCLLFALLEVAFRLNWFPGFLPLRSVGSYHAQFEQKLSKLDDYVKENDGVDVIILGNSMVNTGIDAARVAYRYENLTGQKLRIFNFGVEGLTIDPISDLAKILATKYHPGTILVFTEMRDYVAGNGDDVAENFLDNSWIHYELGNFSIGGFVLDHSQALQHLLSLRNWSRTDFLDSYRVADARMNAISDTGYEVETKTVSQDDITRVPSPKNPNDAQTFAQLANFVMAPDRIDDLNRILSLNNEGIRVLISEIPAYPTYYTYFGDVSIRDKYLSDITSIVDAGGSTFIPTVDPSLIPLEGRADNHHLNLYGAPIYSYSLARQLATYCQQQSICLTAAGTDQP